MENDMQQMLTEGHRQMDHETAAMALQAFSEWLDRRRNYLKANDPDGLVALWEEFSVE